MELTRKQAEGLQIAVQRYQNHEKYTVISGYAGSGKSTLVRFIVSALNVNPDNVCYACFTGKAAQVLLKKGNKNVTTLHKLLYESYPLPNGQFMHRPKLDIYPYQVVIVDECSMAPKDLVNLLLRHNCYVIFLGDPFQLPPINPEDDNHLLDKPNIFLDEIMRQAQENEIIRLSMDIREGKNLSLFDGHDAKVFNQSQLVDGMLMWADQILCATNATRVQMNNTMRAMNGRDGPPQAGDKLIVLRNYWDDISFPTMDPLVNGTVGTISQGYKSTIRYPYFINGGGSYDAFTANFTSETGADFGELEMDYKLITSGEKGLDWKTEYALNKSKKWDRKLPKELTYGYAITGHKSQGSQWDNVLVLEERFPFAKTEHARWLYTTCTRAAEKLVLIRKD